MRAVVFDVGNTLLQINYVEIARALAARGYAVPQEAVYEAECHARLTLDGLHMAGAEAPPIFGEYFRALCMHLGLSWDRVTQAALDDLRAYDHQYSLWDEAIPWSHPTLQALQEAGYILGAVSNSDGSAARLLARHGLDRYLRFVIDSFVVGVEKPHPQIFDMALEHTGTAPEETAYIGDLYRVDIEGARGVGMHGILVDPIHVWHAVTCPKVSDLRHLPELLSRPHIP